MRLAKSFLGSFTQGMGCWKRRKWLEADEDNDRRAASAMDETLEPAAQHLTHDTIGAALKHTHTTLESTKKTQNARNTHTLCY